MEAVKSWILSNAYSTTIAKIYDFYHTFYWFGVFVNCFVHSNLSWCLGILGFCCNFSLTVLFWIIWAYSLFFLWVFRKAFLPYLFFKKRKKQLLVSLILYTFFYTLFYFFILFFYTFFSLLVYPWFLLRFLFFFFSS